MKKILTKCLYSFLVFSFIFALIPTVKAKAASAPKVTVTLVKDKINSEGTADKDVLESITFKIKNNTSKKITFLSYGTCEFLNPEYGGGMMAYRTPNGKDVTIAPKKTKKITIVTHQGWVNLSYYDESGYSAANLYFKYDGKYYLGTWGGLEEPNKKLPAKLPVRTKIDEIQKSVYDYIATWWS